MNPKQSNYRKVAFRDVSTGKLFITRSTADTAATLEYKGEMLPLVDLDVSSDSHPFYTGVRHSSPQATRVAQFNARYSRSGSSAA